MIRRLQGLEEYFEETLKIAKDIVVENKSDVEGLLLFTPREILKKAWFNNFDVNFSNDRGKVKFFPLPFTATMSLNIAGNNILDQDSPEQEEWEILDTITYGEGGELIVNEGFGFF